MALFRHSGSNTDGFGSAMRKNIDKRMRDTCDSVPAGANLRAATTSFAARQVHSCHYAPETKCFDEGASFKQYRSVSQRFGDVIIENYREGDMIWANDYHLMLLPALLRSHPKAALAPIGFFLHVAIASSEIVRCLSVRNSLLKGVLVADLVGFQTAYYARHFRQTVSRILAYESLPKGIQVEGPVAPVSTGGEAEKEWSESADGRKGKEKGRFVDVGVFPMGIDVNSLREKKRQPEVQYWVQLLSQRYARMKLLVGRDKLDETQVVIRCTPDSERFLMANPESQGNVRLAFGFRFSSASPQLAYVVLIQITLQTTESNELAGGVSDVVARINAAFSTVTYQPVVFLHVQGSSDRCRCIYGDELERGALILSEFTGTYNYSGFRSCFAVNPYVRMGKPKLSIRSVSYTLSAERFPDLTYLVSLRPAGSNNAFTTSFRTRCLRAHNEHASLSTDPSLVPSLDHPRLIPEYRHSASRLIFVDLEGCLWVRDMSKSAMMEMCKSGKGPMVELPEATMPVLESMADDPKNEIWVLSGLPVKGALERLALRVPTAGIVAENGCFVKTREISNKSSGQSNGARWINMVANLDFAWKGPSVEILNYFTERTPGSFVEERARSVVWRFWTSPPDSIAPINDNATTSTHDICSPTVNTATSPSSDSHYSNLSWARRQAAEAQNHIFDSLGERYGLRIIPGQNSFLVLPNNTSRSTAVGTILYSGGPACSPLGGGAGLVTPTKMASGRVTSAGESTLALGIGGDEKLLRRLNELDDEETVSTSRRGTNARWKLDPREVLEPPYIPKQKMWLLDVRAVLDREKDIQEVDAEIEVLKWLDDKSTSYAILSHRWGTEVNYGEMTGLAAMEVRKREKIKGRDGYQKIVRSCKQAEKDGYSWLWIDTCCIDKRSSAELSEAINSMYRWYRNAQRCYVYLGDVDESTFPTEQDFSKFDRSNGWPEWFSRGWTLQELIAPKEVEFFNKNWVSIGTKEDLTSTLEGITRIPSEVLRSGQVVRGNSSVAQIMSWAADRTTTRVEDRAYSLLGLLGVNMPLLYGEESGAFQRLQLEIIRVSSDHSIFAWNPKGQFEWIGSVLADDPSHFRGCHDIERVHPDEFVGSLRSYMRQDILGRTIDRVKLVLLRRRARSLQLSRWDVTNVGIQVTLPVLPDPKNPHRFAAVLPYRDHYGNQITHNLESLGNKVCKSWLHGYYNGCPEFRSLYLDFSRHTEESHFNLRLDDSRTSWYGFTRCGTFPREVAGDTARFSSQGNTLIVLVYANNDTRSRFAVGLGYYLGDVRACVFCDECPVNPEAWSSWAGFAKQAYDTLWNAPSREYAPQGVHLPRSIYHARIIRGCSATRIRVLGAELWPPCTGWHELELNGMSAGLEECSGQEIALGDYGDSLDGNFKRCGNIFEDMRELGVDLTDSAYRPVVSRISSREVVRRGLQTRNDVDVVVTRGAGKDLALHQSKGLSLPNSRKFKRLLRGLSSRVESKRLVRTVVQCSEFYRVDFRGRRVDVKGALEGGNRSADPGIVTPLCFIADPLTWHKPTSARIRQQFKGIREHFYTAANLHDVAGTEARHKSAHKQKTSEVIDFSAIFGLNYLKIFVGEITFFERLPSIMESQLCNEPGEPSVCTEQGNGLPAHPANPTFLLATRIRYMSGDGLMRYLSRDERRKTRNELKLISQTLSVEASVALLDRIRSSLLKGSEDEQSTGQGSHPDYDPVNVRSTVREIAYLQGKLQATHDEGEQCALEEDITGKANLVVLLAWDPFRSGPTITEGKLARTSVVDRIRNDADEDYHYRTGLRQIAEIIKRAPHEIPDDDIVHLRRVMYDAGTGVSKHRLWLDAQATEQAELSGIFGDKPILAIEEIASSTSPELRSTPIV
ncbi:glycosyltransferase family 20-domain-containing protein [Pisolithus marmoratus]|nr:glycosyltransferase family 20-domain-containing protein [Pisolithus marmoratus]